MNAKWFLAYATLLCGVVFLNPRLDASVESDIVGYTTIQMDAGKWYQVGNPFVDLQGKTEIPISEVFASGFKNGDTLFIHDPQTTKYSNPLYWHEDVNAWCETPYYIPGTAAAQTLNVGQAVYINKSVASQVTLCGKVEVVDSPFGTESGNSWNQIVIVWPEEKGINDFAWTGLKNGDTLMLLNSQAMTYDTPLYWNESLNEGKGAWSDLPYYIPASPSTKVISAGQGIFINKVSPSAGAVSAR